MTKSLTNTIYVISKGRPDCITAKMLTRIGYPGEWFIVCGNNDEALPEYRERWGERVLVFDWYEQVKHTDTMDNFGFENMASGACPVRNATAEISRRRGELRHWQLDDDYVSFAGYDTATGKNVRMTGDELYRCMLAIAELAHECGLGNAGFPPSTREVMPGCERTFGRRVFNAHNLPSGGKLFEPWVARMNDDLINAINMWRHGKAEMTMRFMSMNMPPTQSETGGLSQLYKDEGTVRKTAYAVMACPCAVSLTEKFGRYHHHARWDLITPKIVSDEHCRA